MTVFISRVPLSEGAFEQILRANGIQVRGESLIEFSAIPFETATIPAVDWMFFYSQNGVRFFFQQVPEAHLQVSQYAVIGAATGRALAAFIGRDPDYIGPGDPDVVAQQFGPLSKEKRVLFVRALHSEQSVQQRLQGIADIHEVVAYANEKRRDFEQPNAEVLVFTSPMNAEAFFDKFALQPHQRVVAIGQTTAAKLKSLGIKNPLVADAPTEEGLAKAVLLSLGV